MFRLIGMLRVFDKYMDLCVCDFMISTQIPLKHIFIRATHTQITKPIPQPKLYVENQSTTHYLHCRIHHSNLELRTTLPVVAWQRIHIHLLQLDELGISNRNRFSEGIYLQPDCFVLLNRTNETKEENKTN